MTPSARWPICVAAMYGHVAPRPGAVGARGGRQEAEKGERERRRERAQRPGEGLDRARDHHPILNTRRPASRA